MPDAWGAGRNCNFEKKNCGFKMKSPNFGLNHTQQHETVTCGA